MFILRRFATENENKLEAHNNQMRLITVSLEILVFFFRNFQAEKLLLMDGDFLVRQSSAD